MKERIKEILDENRIESTVNGFRVKGSRKILTNKEVCNQYISDELDEVLPKDIILVLEEILSSPEEDIKMEQGASILEVQKIMNDLNIYINVSNNTFYKKYGFNRNPKDRVEVNTLITNYNTTERKNKNTCFSDSELLVALDALIIQNRDTLYEELLNAIEYDESIDDSFLDDYFTKLHNTLMIEEDIDVFITAFKHFFWQVKRRINCQKTSFDLMISIFGAQGIGKSTLFVEIFTDLFKDYYNQNMSVENAIDDRWTPALGNTFISNFDEIDTGKLDKISGKEMAKIKQIITGNSIKYRPLNTNTTQIVEIRTCFISTANFHFYSLFNDDSGMRRFLEFNSARLMNKHCNPADVNWLKDNVAKAFKCIDAFNNDKGYYSPNTPVGKKIAAIQATYIPKTSIKTFFKDYEYNTYNTSTITHKDLYEKYISWCEDLDIEPKYRKKKSNISDIVKDMFGKQTVINNNNTHSYEYKLIKKSEIPAESLIMPIGESKKPLR